MKFEMLVPMNPDIRFASDAKIDCVGKHLEKDGKEVATIIGYRIVDGQLMLKCETFDEGLIDALSYGIFDHAKMSFGFHGTPAEPKD